MADEPNIAGSDFQAPCAQHPFREVVQMFVGNRAAVVAFVILVMIILAALFGPLLYPTDPFEMVWAPFTPPGTAPLIKSKLRSLSMRTISNPLVDTCALPICPDIFLPFQTLPGVVP